MDADRTLKRLLIVAAAFFGLLITVGIVAGPDDGTTGRSSRPAADYSHDELQPAANMTQQMSTPNAQTDARYHAGDEQLQRSQGAGYVQTVEQHQADVDRMLGRGAP